MFIVYIIYYYIYIIIVIYYIFCMFFLCLTIIIYLAMAVRGRVDDLSFFEYLSSFCFLSIEFHWTFSISYKILPYFFYYYCIELGCDRPSGLLLFVPALLLSILTPLFCVSSTVSLSYFVLAVPMPKCLGKHSCMSSPCPIAILNGTLLFREAK